MLKTKRIGLIVTEQEKNWVVQLARLEGGLTQASLLRRLIYQAAQQKGLPILLPIENQIRRNQMN